MKDALRDVVPAAAFAGGLGLLCYGLTLVYLPLGLIVGGCVLAVGAVLYEQRRTRTQP